MKVHVAGASGATGRWVVKHLLEKGHEVIAVVRSPERLPNFIRDRDQLTVIQGSLLELSDQQIAEYISHCDAIVSCLGHNMSFKGIFGSPRRLVTEATRRLCLAAITTMPNRRTKFLLMNTVAYRRRDLDEPTSFSQRLVIALLRLFLPPHPDNEQAAEYLRTKIGQNHQQIDWVAIRPGTLIDQDVVTPYEIVQSPKGTILSDPGKTSRINVGHFMADLIMREEMWEEWKGQMPVIYNQENEK